MKPQRNPRIGVGGKSNVHIVLSKGAISGWAVLYMGEVVATASSQLGAAAIGRRIAKKYRTELVIHGRDGRIRVKNSYGSDPYPPKG